MDSMSKGTFCEDKVDVPHRETLTGNLVSGREIDPVAAQRVLYLESIPSVATTANPRSCFSVLRIYFFSFFISIVLVPST